MVKRLEKLSNNSSFFLFGARGTGKSTLLKSQFDSDLTLWIDLLTAHHEDRFGRFPDELTKALKTKNYSRVVIDEIQKSPKLLDVVHREIENNKNIQFCLTGSSARKLKRGSANLLAGRAFTYYLHPFTFIELGSEFNLQMTLERGSIPGLLEFNDDDDKTQFLKSYVRNYLREEIQIEQIVRNVDPFRNFLEISSSSNGHPLNYSKIAKDVGVDDKTVRSYFEILEDTLLGFHLPSFSRSIRKQQRKSPKFFLFDCGVKRALDRTLNVHLQEKTFAYGSAFEHLLILESIRLNTYLRKDFRFSYLLTKDDVEIDLIIDRPGQPDLLVEIKSTELVREDHARSLLSVSKDWDREYEAQIWSRDPLNKKIENINCIFWMDAIKKLFEII